MTFREVQRAENAVGMLLPRKSKSVKTKWGTMEVAGAVKIPMVLSKKLGRILRTLNAASRICVAEQNRRIATLPESPTDDHERQKWEGEKGRITVAMEEYELEVEVETITDADLDLMGTPEQGVDPTVLAMLGPLWVELE